MDHQSESVRNHGPLSKITQADIDRHQGAPCQSGSPCDGKIEGLLNKITRDDSDLARTLIAAVSVAASLPLKRAKYVSDAKVYWGRIEELRDALDALGVQWRPR